MSSGGLEAALHDVDVSLAELQTSHFVLEWYEALGVVQSVCKALIERGDIGPVGTRPTDIVINRSGGVSVAVEGVPEHVAAARGVGEILHGLLPEGGVPAPLRLVVSQASFTPPVYDSVEAFSQALEFFERPNRTEIVKRVYARYTGAPTEAKSEPEWRSPPTQAQDRKQPRWHLPRLILRLPRLNLKVSRAPVVAFALVAGALVARGVFMRAPSASRSVLDSGNKAMNAATTAVDKVVDRVLAVAGREPTAASTEEPEAPVVSIPRPSRARPSDRRPAPLAPAAEPPTLTLFGLSPPLPEDAVSAPALRPAPVESAGVSIIYSESDAMVVPPVAIYPRLPTTLPSGGYASGVAVIDAVIDESGHVESVRVRRAPSTMSEAMIVTMTMSATKAWRFHPGMLEGVPVKYRQAIWVRTN